MYTPSYFLGDDLKATISFLKEHPFATLIGVHEGLPAATQIPVLVDEREAHIYLSGHIMKNTDHHKAFVSNNNALLMFSGPNCYVSSSWYTKPSGATWNYMTVHISGKIELYGTEETYTILKRLTEKFEGVQEDPLYIEKLSEEYITQNIKGIAGFTLKAERITPIFKLSQNRDDESYINIVNHLKNGNYSEQEIGRLMVKLRPACFEESL